MNNRIILFKALNTDFQHWVFGTPCNNNNETVMAYAENGNMFLEPIIPNTICEYTNKDDSRNEPIFENDVLLCSIPNTDDSFIGTVVFEKQQYCIKKEDDLLNINNYEVKIVGNIYNTDKERSFMN